MAFILAVSMQKSNIEFALHIQVTRRITYSCVGELRKLFVDISAFSFFLFCFFHLQVQSRW